MGSGYRTFTAGEVLTASNVQNYLQDQAVMVFAGTAARSSAIGTANFEEGMVTYLTDVDQLQVYNGTSWSAVGANQGLTLLNTTSFSAVSSQSISSIFSATYNNYRVVIVGKNDTTDNDLYFRFRSGSTDLTASDYFYTRVYTQTTTGPTRNGTYSNNTVVIGSFGDNYAQLSMDICSPFLSQRIQATCMLTSDLGNDLQMESMGFGVKNTNSYDGFTFYPAVSTMTGSVSVYGYNK